MQDPVRIGPPSRLTAIGNRRFVVLRAGSDNGVTTGWLPDLFIGINRRMTLGGVSASLPPIGFKSIFVLANGDAITGLCTACARSNGETAAGRRDAGSWRNTGIIIIIVRYMIIC